jgi:hypothetical protein
MTFGALQHSKEKAFNPVKLVECLGIRTGEQQDAQEQVNFWGYCPQWLTNH